MDKINSIDDLIVWLKNYESVLDKEINQDKDEGEVFLKIFKKEVEKTFAHYIRTNLLNG